MTTTAGNFKQEFGAFIFGGAGHTLVLASPGYPDILIQRAYLSDRGYVIFRRGDTDVIAAFRTQREAKAYALAARAIDAAGE